jgi:cytochrome c553
MKRLLRWIGLGLAGLVAVAVFAVLGAFAASEVMLRRTFPKAQTPLVAASDPAAVARGRLVATVNGCHDCHGADMAGKLFHDEMPIVRVWAPNLTLAVAQQSDAELEGAIRHGVAADGRSLWIMPSEAYALLDDRETADLLAYLRTFPPRGEVQPAKQVGPVGRLGVLLGKFDSAPAMLKREKGLRLAEVGPEHSQGRTLARACVECHGPELSGREVMKAPDLEIAASYDLEDFERLLRTGVAAGDRKVGLMTQVAPARFSGLSDEEIAALHGYLKARADQAAAAAS